MGGQVVRVQDNTAFEANDGIQELYILRQKSAA